MIFDVWPRNYHNQSSQASLEILFDFHLKTSVWEVCISYPLACQRW